jgi:hypothetical protein
MQFSSGSNTDFVPRPFGALQYAACSYLLMAKSSVGTIK